MIREAKGPIAKGGQAMDEPGDWRAWCQSSDKTTVPASLRKCMSPESGHAEVGTHMLSSDRAFIHPKYIFRSFSKYILSASYASVIILGAGQLAVRKSDERLGE